MKKQLSLLISIILTLPLLGGCAMKPAVDMSLVKDGLVIPSGYIESGYLPDMQAAIERGLVLETVDFTYVVDVSGNPPMPGGNHLLLPGEISYPLKEGVAAETTIQIPDEYYLTLQAYYRKAFEAYLLQMLRLDLIEKKIEESGLDFRQVEYEEMSRFEKLSNLNLKHMYICIPMRIEQLSQVDADELKRLYAENGSEITKEALEFVKHTYPTVIREAVFDGETYYLQTSYGISWNPESLVISFTMPDVYGEGNAWGEEQWAAEEAREKFLLDILPRYWKEMQVSLDAPLTLLIEVSDRYYRYTITDEIYRGASLYIPE